MFEFDYFDVESLEEGLKILEKCGGEASVIAGGTDLHVLMSMKIKTPRFIVSIRKMPELGGVHEQEGRVHVGATLTHTEVCRSSTLGRIGSLCRAAASVGSPQIRNVGTVGGNIANASPAADLYPPLLTLDATVMLQSSKGTRELAVDDFAMGPGLTRLKPDEIITGFGFVPPSGKYYADFVKIGLRNALAISVASAAILATCKNGRFDDVRIACGAVAPRALRMRRVEAILAGETPTEALVSRVAEVAQQECDPITDVRATREYRKHVTGVVVSRLIANASRDLMGRDIG